MDHKERMLAGLWYDANYDPDLLAMRERADDLCFQFNQTSPKNQAARAEILQALMPGLAEDVTILAPLYMDYGSLTQIGAGSFVNHNAYFMDGGTISLGRNCFIGPNCGFYTADHPLVAAERNQGLEMARPIKLGDNVWLGADVTVLPGVTIGAGSVIGAKSVVTKDIPAGVLALGNPCRVVREITDQDSIGDWQAEA
ncbi:maltose acetyltransferase [Aerococcus urinaehominis]|uniref:Acetyltransferase n=1 Tax=Aerococcus urinaehominis TaxID=128944 RepID=A0A0X8FMF0_9LACT|nr:sugar O-acetyltransferase [Aerococcus urinaehominis]AMB99950.1 maltose acetyltransferase [Aerococcus urinaehominis]SDM42121.1 hypothetical protein SAMN04487985_1161 [Aerococcus urinaehominis]